MNLGAWMNEVLIGWGVNAQVANLFDEAFIAVMLVGVAIGLDYLCQTLFVGGLRKVVRRTHFQWDTLLMKRKVVHYLVHTLPALFVYVLLPVAFLRGKELLVTAQKICSIYILLSLLLAINGFLLTLLDLFNQQEKMKNRPLRGFIQVLQVLVFFAGGIIIVSIIINKSPATLFAGLGASAAILMLVFKDSILGFVAGIQLLANDMLRVGDWITVPSAGANGIVQEITLNTVKVQNFDNTISTIPPYNLINSSFQNWRGMTESAGRRVSRKIFLDLRTIQFCAPALLERVRKEIPLLADYQPGEGVLPTNSQLFRVYAERYLNSLPIVNQELDLIVRQLQSTEYGVPVEIYFFLRDKVWREYEIIQSDIFDHLLAMVPAFDLRIYQYN